MAVRLGPNKFNYGEDPVSSQDMNDTFEATSFLYYTDVSVDGIFAFPNAGQFYGFKEVLRPDVFTASGSRIDFKKVYYDITMDIYNNSNSDTIRFYIGVQLVGYKDGSNVYPDPIYVTGELTATDTLHRTVRITGLKHLKDFGFDDTYIVNRFVVGLKNVSTNTSDNFRITIFNEESKTYTTSGAPTPQQIVRSYVIFIP